MCVCVVVIYCDSNFSLIIARWCAVYFLLLRTLTCNFEEMTGKQLVYYALHSFQKSLSGAAVDGGMA